MALWFWWLSGPSGSRGSLVLVVLWFSGSCGSRGSLVLVVLVVLWFAWFYSSSFGSLCLVALFHSLPDL